MVNSQPTLDFQGSATDETIRQARPTRRIPTIEAGT
jgi:hypothetical protein